MAETSQPEPLMPAHNQSPLDLTGRRVLVMGLGHFGGGVAVVNFLLRRGAIVTLTDLQTQEQLADSLSKIDVTRLKNLVLGEHREQDFKETDLLVVNPAVKPGNPFVQLAIESGAAVTSEIELFWQFKRAKVIAVTGSVGKSTVATLIFELLKQAGWSVHLAGNIGHSLLPIVRQLDEDDWVVLELSSFQLAALDRIQARPDIAVITNFYPNHLDWHGSIDAYREAKQTVCAYQTDNDTLVLNADDLDIQLWPTDAKAIWYGHGAWRDRPGVVVGEDHLIIRTREGGWKIEPEDLSPSLRSQHGLMNVAAALTTVTVKLGVKIDDLVRPLLAYHGLPHRLEFIGEVQGRFIINDSKSTTPESTIAGLNSLTQPIVLILGGKDKGADLTQLAEAVSKKVKAVAILGDVKEGLQQQLLSQKQLSAEHVHVANGLEDAIQWAWAQSSPGDAILLSPACASHSEFLNYEHRGERFQEIVRQLAEH